MAAVAATSMNEHAEDGAGRVQLRGECGRDGAVTQPEGERSRAEVDEEGQQEPGEDEGRGEEGAGGERGGAEGGTVVQVAERRPRWHRRLALGEQQLLGALDTSFCRIYGPPCRSWLRQKRFAFTMTLVLLGLIATTAALPALQSIGAHGTQRLPFGLSQVPHAVYLLTLVVGHLALFGLLALVYATVPLRRPRWSAIWPGAAVATVIASLVSVLFPLYAAQATLAHAGATVGFALLVLVWFYVVAVGLLAGATLNTLRADRAELNDNRGDRSGAVGPS